MKKTTLLVVVLVFALSTVTAHASRASVWTLPEEWSPPSVVMDGDGFIRIDAPDLLSPCAPVGAPDLPYALVRFAVPDGCTVESVAITDEAFTTTSEGTTLRAIREAVPSGSVPVPAEPDATLYAACTNRYEVLPVEIASGVRFLPVKVWPVRYDAATRTMSAADRLAVTVTWRAAIMTRSVGSSSRISPALRALALSSENVVVEEGEREPLHRITTQSTGSTPDVIIISPPDFVSLWEGYAAYRATTVPYTFAVKNTDEIYEEFADAAARQTIQPNGTWAPDHALAIHKYIESVYATGTHTIILGATPPLANTALNTANQLPIRYVRNKSQRATNSTDYYVASDLYFACMDRPSGSGEVWDPQEDGVYCGTGSPGGSIAVSTAGMDWCADLVVMRVPLAATLVHGGKSCSAADQMTGFINKIRRTEGEGESFDGRGKTFVDGGMTAILSSYRKGSTDAKVIGEREFFDDQLNMFDPAHPNAFKDTETDPRQMAYDVFSAARAPQKMYVMTDELKNDEFVRKQRANNPQLPPAMFGQILYGDRFLKYSEAIKNDGDVHYVHSHGVPTGIDIVSYDMDNLWKQTSVQKFCIAGNPCLTGRIDMKANDKLGDNNVRCASQAGVLAPDGGVVASFNNTRMGLSLGNRNSYSPRLDYLLCRYTHGMVDGVEYPAGLALLKTQQDCADMNDGNERSICLEELIGLGDPFIKLTPQRDRVWTGAAAGGAWSSAATNWTSCVSSPVAASNSTVWADAAFDTSRRVYAATDEANAAYSIDGDFSTTELRLEGAAGGAITLSGGRFRSTVIASVTNATTLTWESAGGAGRDGLEFVGGRGTLNLPGTAKRYFGTKFSNVAAINATGGNATLDFSYHAVAPVELSFCAADAASRNVYTNTVRSNLDNSAPRLAADATVPVRNSTLRIENSGFLRGADGAASAIAATNASVVVANGPRWDKYIISRGVELNGSDFVLAYPNVQLGEAGRSWRVSATGGISSLMTTTDASFSVADDVTFDVAETATLFLAARLSAAAGSSIVKTGAGALSISTALSGFETVDVRQGTVEMPLDTNVTVSLSADGSLRISTTAAALADAATTPVPLCRFAAGSHVPSFRYVAFVDSASGDAIETTGRVTVAADDGFVYLAAAGAVEESRAVKYTANVTGDAAFPGGANLVADTEWSNDANSSITLTNSTAAATVTFAGDVTAGTITVLDGGDLTLATNGAPAMAVGTVDFSAHEGTTSLNFAPSAVKAGANTIFPTPLASALSIGADRRATFTDFGVEEWMAAGGMITGPGVLRYGGTAPLAAFPYGGETTPHPIAVARPLAATALDIGGGNTSLDQTFILEDGFSARVTQYRPGNGKGTCNIAQTGGSITVTGANNATSTSCSLLFGHWPGTLNYAMTGGEISAPGQFRPSWHGSATINIGGGGGEARITASGLCVPSRQGSGTAAVTILTNGVLTVGADGILLVDPYTLTLAGGTLAFASTARVSSETGISLAADSTIDVASDAVVTVASPIKGPCVLAKTGEGELDVSRLEGFSGVIDVRAGTLRLEAATVKALAVHDGGEIEIHGIDESETTPLFRTSQPLDEIASRIIVYGLDGEIAVGSLSMEDGVVRFGPSEATVHPKPAGDAYGLAFGFLFTGATDGSWTTAANWTVNEEHLSTDGPTISTAVPAVHASESLLPNKTYAPLLFDGHRMSDNVPADADGKKLVTSPNSDDTGKRIEGYEVKFVLTNNVRVVIGKLLKLQSTTLIAVDETSQLVIDNYNSGGNGNGDKDFYVNAPSGILFNAVYNPQGQAATYRYHLGEKGSVQYSQLTGTVSTHKIADLALDFGKKSLTGTVVKSRRLVGFDLTTHTFTGAGANVVSSRAGVSPVCLDAVAEGDAPGSYAFRREDDGFYVDYAAYAEEADTISVNFTHGGNNLTTSEAVGVVGVAGSLWQNIPPGGSSGTELFSIGYDGTRTSITGSSLSVTGSRGSYLVRNLPSSSDLRHGYIDDDESNATPTVVLSGIPFAKIRVVVYHSTDSGDFRFGHDTINGVDYCSANSSLAATGDFPTVKGTTPWGASAAQDNAHDLCEGVNYLVSDVIENTDTVTIVAHRQADEQRTRDKFTRTGIAAIQIVEIPSPKPADYTATVAGDVLWSTKAGLTDESGVWIDSATNSITLATASGARRTVTFDVSVTASAVALTGDGEIAFALGEGASFDAGTIDLSAFTGTLVVTDESFEYVLGDETSLSLEPTADMMWTEPFATAAGRSLTLAPAANATLTVAGAISGNGAITTGGEGTTVIHSIAAESHVAVESGVAVPGAAIGGAFTVNQGGTFDFMGQGGTSVALTLAGGSLVNSGADIAPDEQTVSFLTITEDSSIGGAGSFPLFNGSAVMDTWIMFESCALTKEGQGTLFLPNSLFYSYSSALALRIEEGAVQFGGGEPLPVGFSNDIEILPGGTLTASGEMCTLHVESLSVAGTLDLSNGIVIDGPVSFDSGATVKLGDAGAAIAGAATVADGATVTLDVSDLTATNGATVVLSAASGNFSAANVALPPDTAGWTLEVETSRITLSFAEPDWPASWTATAPDEIKAKFAVWKASQPDGWTPGAADESAFLLGISADEEPTLEIDSIVIGNDGAVTISANKDLSAANGNVYVLYGDTPTNLNHAKSVTTTDAVLGQTGSPARFFRIFVGYALPDGVALDSE